MQTPETDAIRVFCPTQADTEQLAARMAAHCPEAAVLYLRGELGAGKSAFARAFLHALGVAGPIKSPTYTLLECYPMANQLQAVHMDLYRISDADELEYLALDELMPDLRVLLVEWPDVGVSRLPIADVGIDISQHAEGRMFRITPSTARTNAWLQHLTA